MIKKIFTYLIILFAALGLAKPLMAQNNVPISCSPILTPPYTLNLSDFSALGSQKLMVYLHTNDLDISRLPVKLQLKIESVGISIENQPSIVTTPIYLDGGATNVLYGSDLADYFNINNLTFQGYSKDAYRRAGQLPEGFYRFSISVIHYYTHRLVSNTGTLSAWIVVGKPPTLKFPLNEDYIGDNVGMPITFSWLSSNAGSPAAVGSIQYTLQLWEMRIDNINPNLVVATIPVFFEETVFNTAYTFYTSTMIMEPGHWSRW
jgi:hypothetical protein